MDTNLTLELFIGRGMIDKSLAKDIKEEMATSGKELPEVLADFGIIGNKDDIWQMIASDLGTEFITLDNFQPDPNVQNMMPATLVRLHGALPVRYGPEGLYVCLVDPLNPQTVEDLRFALGQDIHVLVAPDYQITDRINELYGGESAAMKDLMQELNNMEVSNETEDSAAAPVIRFVDLVITQAIKEKASDIHFEPFEKEFKIRYRVDGKLVETLDLSVNATVTITGAGGGTNVLVVQDGEIWCSEASCPDKLCVKQGKKHLSTDTIVCLPNKMVVTVTGTD